MSDWNKPLPARGPAPGPKPETKGGTVEKTPPSDAATFMRSTHGLTSSRPNIAKASTRDARAATFQHARSTGKVP